MHSSRSYGSRARSGNGTSTKPDVADRQALIDAKYYPPRYRWPNDEPNNIDEIKEKLRQRRPSTSNDDFLHFVHSDSSVKNKAEVLSTILPIILGKRPTKFAQNYHFRNLKKIADISKPTPDYFNGSSLGGVSRGVWNNLGGYIVPAPDNSRPQLPNFFFELNPSNGNPAKLELKIVRDLAYGARGIQKIQCYGQDQPVFDGNAYAIGCTYQYGSLELYTMHPTQPTNLNEEPTYWTSWIAGFKLTRTADEFREGVAAFRNAQDWAKEQRKAFIKYINNDEEGEIHEEDEKEGEYDEEEEEEVGEEEEEEEDEDEEDEDEEDEDEEEEEEEDEDEDEDEDEEEEADEDEDEDEDEFEEEEEDEEEEEEESSDELQRPSKPRYYFQRLK